MRAGALTERETDAAQLHPYHGERALASLGGDGKAVAALVLRHHERLDGSGYHRYARRHDLSPAARILAAAEAFQTAREARPHRPALSDAAAAAKLRSAVRDGKLCPEAVEAVLACAGQPARRATAERLAGLTPREIEVLRLIAAGHTAKEAARKLEIAPKTADNHIQSLYSKIGVTTRAGAALYALERGLVQQGISPHRESTPCAERRCGHLPDREPGHCGAGQGRRRAMILATTKVDNFDHFLKIFSTKGAEKRKQHGSKGCTVFRDPSEENRVWAIFDWDEKGWAELRRPTRKSRRS